MLYILEPHTIIDQRQHRKREEHGVPIKANGWAKDNKGGDQQEKNPAGNHAKQEDLGTHFAARFAAKLPPPKLIH
jgi:hypothetical protein